MREAFWMKGIVFGTIIVVIGTCVLPVSGSKLDETGGNEMPVIHKQTRLLSFDNPSWQWAVKGGGTANEDGWSICLDTHDNAYITGSFEGTATFGSTTLVSSGSTDVFVAKLDSDGAWQWAVKGGGTSNDEGQCISVDSDSNTYITGSFEGTATFGSTTLVSSGSTDVFVAKLDSDGAWQWAVKGGGAGIEDRGYSVCVDSSGNIYVTGDFSGVAVFGSSTLTSIGICDAFVAKLSTNGDWMWAVQSHVGGTGGAFGIGILFNTNGDIYITGYFAGGVEFGSTILTSGGIFDVFIAGLDSDGVWQWAVQSIGVGSYSFTTSLGICIDNNGNTNIIGMFTGTTEFGSTTLSTGSDLDLFVAQLSSSNVWQWAVKGGGAGMDSGSSIHMGFNNNLLVTGLFEGTATFGSTTLVSSGSTDVFVANLDSDGAWQWAIKGGGSENDQSRSIAVYPNGDLCITGRFKGTAVFDSITLVSSGGYDVFVAGLSIAENQPPVADFTWTPENPYTGQIVMFNASQSYDPDGSEIWWYQWDWNNDGVYDEGTDTALTPHSWSNPGTYPVTLRVTNDDYEQSTITQTVNVTELFSINITGGFGVTAVITNIGSIIVTDLQWTVTLTDGFIIFGKTKSGTVTTLIPEDSESVRDRLIIGFGKTTIRVDVTCAEGIIATKSVTGTVIVFFVLGIK